METYKSNREQIAAAPAAIYASLMHPTMLIERLKCSLDALPEQARQALGQVHLDESGITFDSPMGPVRLATEPAECIENERVVYCAQQSPVQFGLTVDLEPDGEQTWAVTTIAVDLPFFLRGMVGGKLRDGAQQMGRVLAALPYSDDVSFA